MTSKGNVTPVRGADVCHRVADIRDDHQVRFFPLVKTSQRKQPNLVLTPVNGGIDRLPDAAGQRPLMGYGAQNIHIGRHVAERHHPSTPWMEPAFAIAVRGICFSLSDEHAEIRTGDPLKVEHDIRQGYTQDQRIAGSQDGSDGILQAGIEAIDEVGRLLRGHNLSGRFLQVCLPIGIHIHAVGGQRLTIRGDEHDDFHAHIQLQNRRQSLEFGDYFPRIRLPGSNLVAQQGSDHRAVLSQPLARLVQQALDLVGILALHFRAALLELVTPFEMVNSRDHADHRHRGETAQEQRLPLKTQEKAGMGRRVHSLKNSNSLGIGKSREFHPAYFAINGNEL